MEEKNQEKINECDCGSREFDKFDVCTNCGARKKEGCFDMDNLCKNMNGGRE